MRHKVSSPLENQFLDPREYTYLSSWEISAIREFLHFYNGFKNFDAEDRKRLADCFFSKISDEQVNNAVQTLESLGFIKKDAQGNYYKTKQNIRSVRKTPAAYLTLCQNMKHALEIINRTSPQTRIFKNVIVSISAPTYEVIEKKIQEFCREILEIVCNDSNPEDRLYSLGLQFFPLTKAREK